MVLETSEKLTKLNAKNSSLSCGCWELCRDLALDLLTSSLQESESEEKVT